MSSHNHDQGHSHANSFDKNTGALKAALILTATFMVIEVAGGYFTHSLALLSDGIHMLTDAAALGMSLAAFYIARRPVSKKRSFGFYRLEVLAAFANGIFLIILSCMIITQSWQRLHEPVEIKALETMGIAFIGLLFNVYSAFILLKADHGNLNVRSAFFHVMGDLLGSVGAITAAAFVYWFHWKEADALISILISGIIIVSAWRLISDTVHVMLEGTPSHIDVDEVTSALSGLPGVDEVHDLHVWCISSDIVSLSAHVVSKNCSDTDVSHSLLMNIRELLLTKFNISHVTIQIEKENLKGLEPAHF